MTYNRFIQGLKAAGIEVDRRMLAELAVNDAAAFAALVEVAQGAPRRRKRGRRRPSRLTPAACIAPRAGRIAPCWTQPGDLTSVKAVRGVDRAAAAKRAFRDGGSSSPRGRRRCARRCAHRRGAASVELFATADAATRHADDRRPPRRRRAARPPWSPARSWPRCRQTVTPRGCVAVCRLRSTSPLDAVLAAAPRLLVACWPTSATPATPAP